MKKKHTAKDAKKSYLKRLRKYVATNTYEIFKGLGLNAKDAAMAIVSDAKSSAKSKHNIDLKMKNVGKQVIEVNKKAKDYVKATKDEVISTTAKGIKQAIDALKHKDTKSDTFGDSEDDFLKSLGMDDFEEAADDYLDSFDDEDDELDDDDDNVDYGYESFNQELWQGAKRYAEMTADITVQKISDDEITALILLLVEKTLSKTYPEYGMYREDVITAMQNAKRVDSDDEESTGTVTEGSNDKLSYVKDIITSVNTDMVGNVGIEEMAPPPEQQELEEMRNSGEIVVTIKEEEKPYPTKKDIAVRSAIHKVIHSYFDKTKVCLMNDPEICCILDTATNKIEAVSIYLSSLLGVSDMEVQNKIMSGLLEFVPDCVKAKASMVALAFYLGIIPEDLIAPARRIITIYNKLI